MDSSEGSGLIKESESVALGIGIPVLGRPIQQDSKRLSQVKRNCPGQESKPGWHRVAPKMKGVGLGGLLQVL